MKRLALAALISTLASMSVKAQPRPDAQWRPIGSSRGVTIQSQGDISTNGATVKIQFDGAAATGGAIVSIPAEGLENMRVAVSAKVSADGALSNIAMWVRIDGADGPLAFKTTGSRPQKAPLEDLDVTLSIDTPKGSRRLLMGFVAEGEGVISADEVRIGEPVALKVLPASASDAQALVEEAIAAIREHAFYADRLSLTGEPPRPADVSQAHQEIKNLTASLRDGHSGFSSANDLESSVSSNKPRALVSVDDGVVHIQIPEIVNVDRVHRDEFARDLCGRVSALGSSAVGWIVDLRGNGGGNMWPMLQGLHPLLGAAPLGELVDRTGRSEDWTIPPLDGCVGKAEVRPIVVLIDSATASAAEAVAIAFSGMKNVRLMGNATAGQANANRTIELKDGSILRVMSKLYRNRSGRLYAESIVHPDVTTTPTIDGGDSAVVLAKRWIRDNNAEGQGDHDQKGGR